MCSSVEQEHIAFFFHLIGWLRFNQLMYMLVDTCMELRGKVSGFSSLLPLCGRLGVEFSLGSKYLFPVRHLTSLYIAFFLFKGQLVSFKEIFLKLSVNLREAGGRARGFLKSTDE